MPGVYKLIFTPGGHFRVQRGTRGNEYLLNDGYRLEVWRHPVFCFSCRAYTEGEVVTPVSEVDAQIESCRRELRRVTQGRTDRPRVRERFNDLTERIERLELRRSWSRQRVSPPRCLECGCTELVFLKRGEEIANPSGKGTVRLEWLGMCSLRPRNFTYSPEGDRLPGYSLPQL
ncbi:MAG: hypothetical protein ABIY70_15415 [Capsulimonas sp.]|uniref:hypothetical protein n=1 Tax=Capsulimonas sp. TaxID=2494211 RepID=UPI0032631C2E